MDPTNDSYLIAKKNFTMAGQGVFLPKWYRLYNWLEYSPITNKMYCFACHAFGHRVACTASRVDTEFTTVGIQGQRWKKAATLFIETSQFTFTQAVSIVLRRLAPFSAH